MVILKKGRLEIEFIEENLQSYYKILKCDTIQIINLKINNTLYSFILDDEGKLKENYINIILTHKGKIIDTLVGNIIIQKYDFENDEVKNLESQDIQNISNWFENCQRLIDTENIKIYKTLEI